MGLKMTYAAKVGFWVVLATFVTLSLLSYFGVITILGKRKNEYYIHFHFPSIQGLNKGAKFKINGNEVGTVEKTDISPASGVDVMIRIYDTKYVVHENAQVVIAKESLLGSSYVEAHEPVGGYFDSSVTSKNDYFYLQVPIGKSEVGDYLYFSRADFSKVVGVIEDLAAGEPGYEKAMVKILDNSIKLNHRYAFVPSTVEVKSSVTGLVEKKRVINVFAPLEQNAFFEGTREAGPEDLIVHLDEIVLQTNVKVDQLTQETKKVIEQVQRLLDELSGVIDRESVQEILKILKVQIEKIGTNMDEISGEIKKIIGDSEPRLTATLENIESTSKSIREIAEDPELGTSIKDLTKRLGDVADRINLILNDIEEITNDPNIKEDIKGGIHSAKGTLQDVESTVGEMKKNLDSISKTELSGRMKSRYRPEPDTYFTEIDLYLSIPKKGEFYTIGLDEIGEDNLVNAQLGYRLGDDADARVGIKRSKVGFGLDYHLNRFFLSTDLYNPNDLVLDAYMGMGLNQDVFIVVGGEDIFEDDIFNLGVMFRF